MKLSLFLLGVLVSIGLASSQGQSGRGGSCFCTDQYIPFCGTDEVTYSNKCQLECAQRSNPSLRVKFEGVCAVPYVPDNGHQKPNVYKPTSRPYVPPPPPYRTTRRPYVPLPSPRPEYRPYVPPPPPTPEYRPYAQPPPPTPEYGRYVAPPPAPKPSWIPQYGDF